MPAARARRGKSSSRSIPLRSRCASMRASDVSMRCTRDSLLISSEKNATGTLCSMAAYCAMFSVNAVFPIDGRAATMMRSDGWKPDVISSRSLKPLATPVTVVAAARGALSMRSIVGQSSSLMRVKPSCVCCWLTWKIFDSASSSSSRAVDVAVERLGHDRRRDFDQPAKDRLLANDLRVVLDVRRRRHRVDEKADVVLAARRLEIAAALQLVGERERIDDASALGDRPPSRGRSGDDARRRTSCRRRIRPRGAPRPGRSTSPRAPLARRPPSTEDADRGTDHAPARGWSYREFDGRAGHLPRWDASNPDSGEARQGDT